MKKVNSIALHCGFWVLIYIPTLLFFFFNDQHIPPKRYWFSIMSLIFTLTNFYLFYSFLIPVFSGRKRGIYLVVITIVIILIFPALQHQAFSFLVNAFDWHFRKVEARNWFYTESYTLTILYTGLAYLARFTTRWIMDRQVKAELMNQNQASELALLRSQINPHFLFNTLNNIYSLVYSKAEQAPAAMMKLSDIMRYMLYEANTDNVLLTKEIDYLRSYIELLQLRTSRKNFIRFTVEGDSGIATIPPMLFIPFVENAFKHCSKKLKAPGIRIDLKINEKFLNFKVVNALKDDPGMPENDQGGIGLKNVRRRLELIYPNRHKLRTEKTPDVYIAELIIEL